MPNWTANEVTFEGPTNELSSLLELIGKEFDFNKIIPMPEILRQVTTGYTTINGVTVRNWFKDDKGSPRLPTKEEQAEIDKTGYQNWYDWAVNNWGTKWLAFGVQTKDTSKYRYLEFTFNTAWQMPMPIYLKLKELFPELKITWRWRDEDESPYPHSVSNQATKD